MATATSQNPQDNQAARAQRDEPLALRINDAARACGIGRTSLYELINEGKLKAIRAAGRRLILREDLEAYLRSCRETA